MAYNGWSNYETWNVALWISNDQGMESIANEMTQDAWDNASSDEVFTRESRAALNLADTLKEWFEDQNPLAGQASCFADLLNAALCEVDWLEIANNYISEVDKDEPVETE